MFYFKLYCSGSYIILASKKNLYKIYTKKGKAEFHLNLLAHPIPMYRAELRYIGTPYLLLSSFSNYFLFPFIAFFWISYPAIFRRKHIQYIALSAFVWRGKEGTTLFNVFLFLLFFMEMEKDFLRHFSKRFAQHF